MRTFLAIAFDAAAHEAVVLISFIDELPEAMFSTIMQLDHFAWESTNLFIFDRHLLWLEASELLDALINIP